LRIDFIKVFIMEVVIFFMKKGFFLKNVSQIKCAATDTVLAVKR